MQLKPRLNIARHRYNKYTINVNLTMIIMDINDMTMNYDYEISLFGHRRKKNGHKGIINNKMVETTIKNINISKHDTKLISVVRLVIVIKCAPEISLVQVF